MKQLTLGQLIDKLSKIEHLDDKFIFFSFGGVPGYPHSYRGYYEDLAIKYEFGPFNKKASVFLKELRACLCKEFEGYKGGVFKMYSDTLLWCSMAGVASGAAITGISDGPMAVYIDITYKGLK